MTYIVQFDKHFQDGLLAGLTAAGETISYPTYDAALSAYEGLMHQAISSVQTDLTGNKYTVSRIRLFDTDLRDITPAA